MSSDLKFRYFNHLALPNDDMTYVETGYAYPDSIMILILFLVLLDYENIDESTQAARPSVVLCVCKLKKQIVLADLHH